MPLSEALRLALQAIWTSKLRSFFTLLGIIVSVGFLVVVVAVIQGMNAYVKENLTGAVIGTNAFQVRRNPISVGLLDDEQVKVIAKRPLISEEDAAAVQRAIPEARAVVAPIGVADAGKRRRVPEPYRRQRGDLRRDATLPGRAGLPDAGGRPAQRAGRPGAQTGGHSRIRCRRQAVRPPGERRGPASPRHGTGGGGEGSDRQERPSSGTVVRRLHHDAFQHLRVILRKTKDDGCLGENGHGGGDRAAQWLAPKRRCAWRIGSAPTSPTTSRWTKPMPSSPSGASSRAFSLPPSPPWSASGSSSAASSS